MIAPKCDKCLCELTDFGALAFSPPNADGQVAKYHLCARCFDLMKAWLNERPEIPDSSEPTVGDGKRRTSM